MLERQKHEFLRSGLKKVCFEADLLQAELTKILKKTQSYISKVESGEYEYGGGLTRPFGLWQRLKV